MATIQYVMLSLGTAVLYPIVSTAAYMLGARDLITRWIWSRYPKFLEKWALCAACSGTWYGLGLGALGYYERWPFLGLPGDSVITVLAVSAYAKTLTPILADKHITALINTSDGDDGHDEAPHA